MGIRDYWRFGLHTLLWDASVCFVILFSLEVCDNCPSIVEVEAHCIFYFYWQVAETEGRPTSFYSKVHSNG